MINLFESRTAEAVLKSFLQAKQQEEKARKDAANDRLSIYHDDWSDLLDTLLKAQFHDDNYKNIKIQKNTSQNIVKKVVNEVSIIYKEPPVREFKPKGATGENTEDNEIMTEIYSKLNIDEFMRRVNRYGNLLNDVLVRVGWDADLEQITLDLHTPADTSVIERDDYPEQAAAVFYEVEYPDDQFKTKKERIFWSDFEHFKFDDKGNALPPTEDNEDMKNPYGKLPFIIMHLQPIPGMFWNPTGGGDLIEGTKLIGLKRTLKDYLFKWQSFKQIVIKSMDANKIPDKMLVDPSHGWKMWGEGADAFVLDLQANLTMLDETIKADMNSFLNTYGLSVDMFAASIDESSGRALKEKNRGLGEIREAQLPFFRNFEFDLCAMIRLVYNTYKGENAIPEIDFKIDFAEMQAYVDPMEKRQMAAWDLKNGLISPARFYMMFNQDLDDEEEAEKTITENLAKLREIKGKGLNIDDIFGDRREGAEDQDNAE